MLLIHFVYARPSLQQYNAHPYAFQIAVLQGMKADIGALTTLCEKTDNDIRSCINTLQVSCIVGRFRFSPSCKLKAGINAIQMLYYYLITMFIPSYLKGYA